MLKNRKRWLAVLAGIVVVGLVLRWTNHQPNRPTLPFNAPKDRLGLGVWIWLINATEKGDIDKIVAKAKWAGLNHVVIAAPYRREIRPSGQLKSPFNPNGQFFNLLLALHNQGIRVYGWGYVYGTHPDSEAQRAIDVLKLGSDGYVFDVEDAITQANRSQAEMLCKTVRDYVDKGSPDCLLGYSTYCRVQYKTKIPYDVFGRYCDVAMPQAYWKDFKKTPNKTVREMCQVWGKMEESWRQTDKASAIKPIIPTGQAYNGLISPKEMASFLRAARGYYGVNFWRWDKMGPEQWQILRDTHIRMDPNRLVLEND